MMRLSFKTRALLLFCVIIILVSIISTLVSFLTEHRILRDEIIKRGELLTTVAAQNAELPFLSGNREVMEDTASSLIELENVPSIAFYTPDFEPIIYKGRSFPNGSHPAISADKPVSVVENDRAFEFYGPVYTLRAGEDIEVFEDTPRNGDSKEHIGWVRIGLSKEVMEETEKLLISKGILSGLFLLVVAVLLFNLLLSKAFKPLNMLFQAVSNLRRGDYPLVQQIETNDEVGQLAREFNKMSQAIKDREEKLLYSQKRIRDLFERVEHAIFRMDPDFRIIECNAMFEILCDRKADFFCLIDETKRDFLVKKALEGNLVGEELVIADRDGQEHTIYLSVYPEFDEDGAVAGFDGHFVDITEKQKLEKALLQSQKLESIGMLAGGIAHDFNNILTGIIGYTELSLQIMAKDDPVRDKIEAMYEQGNKAASLTRQLLAFSRKQVMEMEVVNLAGLLQNMTKMLGRLIGENIEMKVLPHRPESSIKADPAQIEQVIMNLAVNARDAMPAGGSLIFEIDAVLLDEAYCRDHPELNPGSYVVFTVTDSGEGMPPDVKENIFDPFFTTKEKGAGTGLGLSTVYGIVKQHEGHIFVYSEPGCGTTFKIYFPEVQEPEEEVQPGAMTRREDLPGGTETILVVDDEPSIRHLIRDTLEPMGYKVMDAGSAEKAEEIARTSEKTIDLLLTDVIMPGASGKQLADTLETMQPGIPVLFMSGYTDDVIAHQGVLEPGINFINKPLIPSTLLRKIRALLDTGRKPTVG